MNIVGILLITIAVLAGIDVVMYLVLSVAEKRWEEKFEEDNDDNERGIKKGGGVLYKYC